MNRKEIVNEIERLGSYLCVGLDTDIKRVPRHLLTSSTPVYDFNRYIVDATAEYCIAYKPNLAFYEAAGTEGMIAFKDTVDYIRENYPEKFIIADAKRGDIGNTAGMYARSFFEHLGVDALTVAPYMGEDSVTPFLGYEGKWVILLALTSNPGSKDFQMIEDKNGHRVFEDVIRKSSHWGSPVNMMYVVGATRGEMFKDIRAVAPRSFLLVPGVGAQGGSLEEVVKYGIIDECGLIVNSSRGIIYASKGEDFAEAAGREAAALAGRMKELLAQHNII